MRSANLESLKEKIVRPDFDKHLVPLMLYRGNAGMKGFGRTQRVWNLAITLMESECETYTQAVKIGGNPDYAHLCGPRRPMVYGSFASVFGRMMENPKVTDNIPGLTDFCKSIRGPKWRLTPVDLYTNDMRHRMTSTVSPWRIIGYSPEVQAEREARGLLKKEVSEARKLVREMEKRKKREDLLNCRGTKPLFYPYLIHKPHERNTEYELMLEVNRAVPAHLPDWLRADICQDLLVAVLAGEIPRDRIKEGVKGFAREVFKMHPIKYGPLSLDAPLSDESDSTFLDVLMPDSLEGSLG